MELEEARRHHREFMKKYFYSGPYVQYLQGCTPSTLRACREQGVEVRLNGESLDDYCLLISLAKEPAKGVSLPTHHGGMRVFYQGTK